MDPVGVETSFVQRSGLEVGVTLLLVQRFWDFLSKGFLKHPFGAKFSGLLQVVLRHPIWTSQHWC